MRSIVAGVIIYALFGAFAFWSEGAARRHAQVITRADLAAIGDHRMQVRAEASRNLAMARMTEWWPYDVFLAVQAIVFFAITIPAVFFAARGVWRRAPSPRLVILVNLFVITATILIAIGPWQLAQKYEEGKRTTYTRDTLATTPK